MSSTPPTNPQAAEYSKEYPIFYQKRIFQECKLEEGHTVTRLERPLVEGPHGDSVFDDFQFIKADTSGNIEIYPFDLKRQLRQRWDKKTKNAKVETFKVVRLQEPNGKQKYRHPEQWGTMPFFPLNIVEAYEKKEPIKTLFITEGYLKALRAERAGMYVVGIAGIAVISDKKYGGTAKLYPDIIELIQVCQVENVIILWDADCRDISDSALAGVEDLSSRPSQFVAAAMKIREALKDTAVDVYMAFIDSKYDSKPKGLDDLLNAADEAGEEAEVVAELLSFNAIGRHHMIEPLEKQAKLQKLFHLDSFEDFYQFHKHKIGSQLFCFKGHFFQFNEETESVQAYPVEGLPKGVDRGFFINYNFFELGGAYYTLAKNAKKGDRPIKLTNYTLSVKYLIMGDRDDAKRIVNVKHQTGVETSLEMSTREFNSLNEYKGRLEALGSFNSPGLQQSSLENIKEFVYKYEAACVRIGTLGQHRHGFWAWANGIYHPDTGFVGTDEYGIVEFKGRKYYLPYLVDDSDSDTVAFEQERKFRHFDTQVKVEEWARQFQEVYRDNGTVGISFLLMSVFRDLIQPVTGQFPLLFCFGRRGSGKSSMVESLMALFGQKRKEFNLGNKGTSKGFLRLFAQFNNAIVWLDEFKRDIDKDKIEAMKGIADNTGYTKAATSNDSQTITTKVTSSAIVAGQDKPNVEPAFYSRLVECEFAADKFGSAVAFQQLRDNEELGLTSVVNELVNYRLAVQEKFKPIFRSLMEDYRRAYSKDVLITERQMKFMAAMVAICKLLSEDEYLKEYELDPIKLPFDVYANLQIILEKRIQVQSQDMQSANEVKVFFEIMCSLIASHTLIEDIDYKFESVTTAEGAVQKLFAFRMPPVHNHYLIDFRRKYQQSGMDKLSLNSYLKAESCLVGYESLWFKGMSKTASCIVIDVEKALNTLQIDFEEAVASVSIKNRKLEPVPMPDEQPNPF